MEHTNAENRDSILSTETQTKKCHICEQDRYLSDYVYLKGVICIESNICVSCKRVLIADKKITHRILRRYSLV